MTDRATIHRLLEMAVAIQQIPAPTFQEEQRADFVLERFKAESLSDVSRDETGNIYARLPGSGSSRLLVVSAHLDTVFPLSTDLRITRSGGAQDHSLDEAAHHDLRSIEEPGPITISGPGIGDNSLGVAGLFGLVWELRHLTDHPDRSPLPGDIWLVANVGEEGLGNLCGMRAIVDRFGDRPLAYLVVEGMALGQVYHRGLGVQRYRLTVDTPGGHSWVDYGRPSAIHVLAEIVTRLSNLTLPDEPRTTLNVGTISGGTTVNTIAAHAQLELDLRSENPDLLSRLSDHVKALAQQAKRPDVKINTELIGQRPIGELPRDHPLVRLAVTCLDELGLPPRLNIGSTDANIPLSYGLPSICLGLTRGSGAHTMAEAIQVTPISIGLQQLINVIQGIFQRL
jgi:tripeptide aminopeptidase